MASVTAYGVNFHKPSEYAGYMLTRPSGREATYWASIGGAPDPEMLDVITMSVHLGLGMINTVFPAVNMKKTLANCCAQPQYGAASIGHTSDVDTIVVLDDDMSVAAAIASRFSAPLGCVWGAAANSGMLSLLTRGKSRTFQHPEIASAPVTIAGRWEYVLEVRHSVTGARRHMDGAAMRVTTRPGGLESRSNTLRAAEIEFGEHAVRYGYFRPAA